MRCCRCRDPFGRLPIARTTSRPIALVRPANTEEVSKVMRWCSMHNGVAVVTQGGLTGLVHGGDAKPDEMILSLERMRAIEDIDPIQRTATVQAGVTLQALQEAVSGPRPVLPARPRRTRYRHPGRQRRDQRRRQPGDPLWHDPRHGARARSGAGRRNHRFVAEPPDQEQHRL